MPSANVVFIDQEGNTASLGYYMAALTTEAATQALIDAVTLGTVKRRTLISETIDGLDTLPGNNFAQAGMKLRIHYSDDVTNKTGFYSIPTVDAAALTIVGKEVSLTAPQAMVDLVADINANWESPDGNAITVVRAELVTVNR